MPPFGPVSRADLIRYLRRLGFSGPFAGGKHPIMMRGNHTAIIPNPHQGDIGKELLSRILKQADIPIEEWERL